MEDQTTGSPEGNQRQNAGDFEINIIHVKTDTHFKRKTKYSIIERTCILPPSAGLIKKLPITWMLLGAICWEHCLSSAYFVKMYLL